ncbi:EmrB/QacA subfamily drug resistance transporter [Actinomadura coerulea]|uniref:EmrB/QacA subfamily drug resistance transporter n=1 Tax=Actinomadura coerulea TaxID=46159 RepID=A0A7X0G7J8_9ACTN|nr:MFS transporter [Actinomadura coerulea]MBB6400679.1 EmrB/QacA subfamily drug resistance transporter [Actinomadura coerulea]GGQ08982.1 MFS transporter [Actinomadura coerulea]
MTQSRGAETLEPGAVHLPPRDQARGRPARAGHGHPWLTLIAVALGVMMVGLDATVVSIANPAIAKDLGASLSGLQWVTNAYLLALAVTLIPAGKIADRFGRKRTFLAGVVGFAVSSVLIGLSGGLGMVIFWRVVQGFAGALLQPASLALLRNTFPAERLNAAIGIWGSTVGISIAGGPIVAGLLVENVNWESVFFLNAPLGLVALLVGLWVIRESRDEEAAGSFDVAGVALLSGALFALVWGLIKAGEHGFGGTVPLVSFAASVVLFAAFVWNELRVERPLLPLGLFRSVSLSAATGLIVLGFFGMFGTIFFITLYLQQVHGMSPVDAGVRMLPMTGVFIVASPVAGALTSRFGPRVPLVLGMAFTAAAMFGLSRIGVDAPYVQLWPWFVLVGLAFGMVIVAGTEAIVGNAPAHLAGVAGGLQQTASQVGGVLGTSVLGVLLSTKVGDVLFGRLTDAGLPGAAAHQLEGQGGLVSQGVAPIPPGTSKEAADAITTGSHLAFMDGFQTSLTVAGAVALVAVLAALLVRRGTSPVEGAAVA